MLKLQLAQASEQKARYDAQLALHASKIKALEDELSQVRSEAAAPAADATAMAQIMFHGKLERFHKERRKELIQRYEDAIKGARERERERERNATMQHANLQKLVCRLNLASKPRDWVLANLQGVERAETRDRHEMLVCHHLLACDRRLSKACRSCLPRACRQPPRRSKHRTWYVRRDASYARA